MSQLQQYERDAIAMAKRISDLKSLTPQFIDARDQAQRSVEKHYRMIEEAEADLAELRTEAAALASRLGEEALTAEVEPEPTPEAIEAILNDDTPFPGIAAANDAKEGPEQAPETFDTVGQVAERITAALAELADDQPDTPDQTDAPELTTEQVERVEADMAAALKAYA